MTKYGNFRRIKDNRFYYFKENCIVCNNSCMTSRKNGKFCSRKCINNFQTGSGNPFYSKHHTNKTKTKIRNKIKGNKHPLYGKHLSDETKEKIRKSKKGKTRVDISGKNHPQWKGGISCKPYCDAWADKEYKEDRK